MISSKKRQTVVEGLLLRASITHLLFGPEPEPEMLERKSYMKIAPLKEEDNIMGAISFIRSWIPERDVSFH